MKLGSLVAFVILACGFVSAQESKTKIIVEDGKEITVTGCVRRNADGGLALTSVAGKEGAVRSYVLALLDNDEGDALDDLKDHIGHRVEIAGKAADRGDGKIRVKTESERRMEDGGKAKTESTSEVKGDLQGLPYLGVKTSRMIASVCP